jgi:hypothetical protein
MITGVQEEPNDLFDLPGFTQFSRAVHPIQTSPPQPATSHTPAPARKVRYKPHAKTQPVRLDPDLPQAATGDNRRLLRLSQESREILKLLKQHLKRTYDQQIQFLAQLVLYHDLLPPEAALQVQKRVRELRHFSEEIPTHGPQPQKHPTHHNSAAAPFNLTNPLPLESVLTALEERCSTLQKELQNLTQAIDARTEINVLTLQTNTDHPFADESEFRPLA